MVVTVEPGLYIPDDPDIPERCRSIGQQASLVYTVGLAGQSSLYRRASRYRSIGIRIEDDVVVGSGKPGGNAEPEVLSASVPKQIQEIEALMMR